MIADGDAKHHWCPFARVCASATDTTEAPAHVGYNRIFIEEDGPDNFTNTRTVNPKIARCIGSACMAWRWSEGPHETAAFSDMHRRPDGDGWVCTLQDTGREKYCLKSRWARPRCDRRRGYCGLAGAPARPEGDER